MNYCGGGAVRGAVVVAGEKRRRCSGRVTRVAVAEVDAEVDAVLPFQRFQPCLDPSN